MSIGRKEEYMKKNGNNQKTGEYYLGLDVGTSSCGWAVTDKEYNLSKFKGKHMWGARLFDEAQDASARRLARGTRRRLERTKKRLLLLETLFNNEIMKKDPAFFIRMHDSNLYAEDKTDSACHYALFNDPDYTDKDYLTQYPTIYHLRQELLHSTEPHDVRLVFLAIHHILKSRGHFLYEASDSDDAKTLDMSIADFKEYLSGKDITFEPEDVKAFKNILMSQKKITEKVKELKVAYGEIHQSEEIAVDIASLVELFSGKKVDLSKLFKDDNLKGSEIKSVSLLDDLDSQYDLLSDILEDNVQILFDAKEIYDLARLNQILGDDAYLSDAKVRLYDKNKNDLRILKDFFIRKLEAQEISKETYDVIFNVKNDKTHNLPSYIGKSDKMCSQEDFCKFLKKYTGEMKDSENEEERRVSMEIENGTFLTKLKGKENGLVPYQLQLKELKKILNNAKTYLPFLSEKGKDGITTEDKIISLLTFRIPYYVGPLAKPADSNKAWLERKDEVIYPWNFTEVVDLQASAKKFMKNLIGKCTYTGEPVLPKDSLLYSKYTVLNEINNLKVNGHPISVENKQKIYTELFLNNKKKLTKKDIKNCMLSNGMIKKDEDEISGVDDQINSNMKSYYDFKNILAKTNNKQQVEDIIEHILVYGSDKKMLKQWLDQHTEGLDESDKKHVLRLNYKDWGRVSGEFLTKVYHTDKKTGEMFSVMDMLWNTNNNLMMLMTKPYDFNAEAKKYRDEHFGLQNSLKDKLDELYIAPAVRRSIWQTMRIVDEIVDIKKSAPEKIFIEMARTSSKEMEKKRTESRKEQLKKLYASCKEQAKELTPDFDELQERLDKETDQHLRSDKLYLYYTQMGKCMYTGEPIDLAMLLGNDQTYDIDHIFPQSKVIDDSLDNRVLVQSVKNRDKTNEYPIKEDIRKKMYSFWSVLRKKGLISEKKYNRLKRATPLTEDELSQFVQRQIVETQQSTKALATILNAEYPDTKIVYSKAGNVSRFRQTYQIPKFRNVNDYHHAKDAYLNIVVGNVFDTKFTENFFKHIMEKQGDYSLNRVFEFDTPGAWIAPTHSESGKYKIHQDKSVLTGTIQTVYKYVYKNTPIVTFAPYQQKGELYDLQIMPKGKGQLPIKQGLDIDKYGGYNKITGSYFFVAEYTDKKKRVRAILPVYLYALKEYEKDPIAYCKDILHLEEPRIIVKKILNSALLEMDCSRIMVTGRSDGGKSLVFKHAYEFAIDDAHSAYLKALDKYVARCTVAKSELEITKYDGISKESNVKLYDWFFERLNTNSYKPLFTSAIKDMDSCRMNFESLSILDQSKTLLEILKLFKCDRQCPSFELLNGKKTVGVIKKNVVLVKIDSAYLINQSVTGLYEVKVDLLKG